MRAHLNSLSECDPSSASQTLVKWEEFSTESCQTVKQAGALPLLTKAGEMGLAEPAEVAPGAPNRSPPAHMTRSSASQLCMVG